MALINDTLMKFIIIGIILMSFIFIFVIKNRENLKETWGINMIHKKKKYVLLGLSIVFSWIIFLYIDEMFMKYIALFLIIILEIIRFSRNNESII
jgi:hypothetical protein